MSNAGGKSKSATMPTPRFGEARIAAARTYPTQRSAKMSDRDLHSTARLYTEQATGYRLQASAKPSLS
jgi:hypothetical protein